jgi:hypothetical protein
LNIHTGRAFENIPVFLAIRKMKFSLSSRSNTLIFFSSWSRPQDLTPLKEADALKAVD